MFNSTEEVKKLKAQTKAIRKRPYKANKSRLDRYTSELVALREKGATFAELQRYLRSKRIKVVLTTVTRYMRKLENGNI